MTILADSHTHSRFSLDSFASLNAMAEEAISKGLKYLTITDHCEFDYPMIPDPDAFVLKKAPYFQAVKEVQSKYKNKLEILLGLEMGLVDSQAEMIEAFIKDEPFDFVIGSSHIVHGRDPYRAGYFDGVSEEEAYASYFKTIAENVSAIKCYNVYGHLDYVVRYGPNKDKNYHPSDYQDIFDEALKTIIADGKGIEINTGGWSRGIQQPHPHPDLLKRYRELGGQIVTFGSDAHKPKYIADRFSLAAEILKNAGFRYYAVYKAQKPLFFAL
ncbi:MAG: histidinol-phosphatase HisJ family protein [Anaerolineaceae bacterium]|nr:histidinol-phosphatase HisJ family protein [Anaerolineaceae bacterium]